MNADILFSVGGAVLASGVLVAGARRWLGTRSLPRRRVADLVKLLAAGRSPQAGGDWGYRLESFGDLVWAFSHVMDHENAARPAAVEVRGTRIRNLHRAGDLIKTRVALEPGAALTSAQVR